MVSRDAGGCRTVYLRRNAICTAGSAVYFTIDTFLTKKLTIYLFVWRFMINFAAK